MPKFIDRRDAGRRLGAELDALNLVRPIVLALPRGGVPVAAELADRLHAALDVWVVRKIRAPWCPEIGIGAVAEGAQTFLSARVLRHAALPAAEIDALVAEQERELEAMVRLYRGGRPRPDLRDRSVIVVDDGVATGGTVRAALESIRRRGPRELIVAVPAGAADTLELLAPSVDRVVCLAASREVYAVGFWYRDFAPVSNREALRSLGRAGVDYEEPAFAWPLEASG